MPKRIAITLIFIVAVAVVALHVATTVWAECTATEESSYECSDDNGKFEVRIIPPFPKIRFCSEYSDPAACDADNPSGKYSEYQYQITNLTTPGASHFNVIVEKPFENRILGESLVCNGSGDRSTCLYFAHGLTWNCLYKSQPLSGSVENVFIRVKGERSSAPSDWYIKAGNDADCCGDNVTPDGWGIIKAPDFHVVQVEPNQPLDNSRIIEHSGITFNIKFNPITGQSYDVECVAPKTCWVRDVNLENLRISIADHDEAIMTWAPFDEPFGTILNPTCTYVRTTSGGVKKVCR